MNERVLANVGQRPVSPAKTLNVALLGFGNVGSSFAEVLHASRRQDVRVSHVVNRGIERKKAQCGPRTRRACWQTRTCILFWS